MKNEEQNQHPVNRRRYPGLVPFSEGQDSLFKGRDAEIEELYQLVRSEQLVVLFAKSGVGKSSLLNAGLFPQLRAGNYYPIKIRFQNPEGSSVKNAVAVRRKPQVWWKRILLPDRNRQTERDMIQAQTESLQKTAPATVLLENLSQLNLDSSYDIELNWSIRKNGEPEGTLWDHLKVLQIKSKLNEAPGNTAQSASQEKQPPADQWAFIPVLVFDQFEEFFQYAQTEQDALIDELAECLHNLIPNRVSQWLRSIPIIDRSPEILEWATQPQFRCIIAMRDDKLSELDALKDRIPLILKNRYKLNALKIGNARQAMEDPARAKGDFESLPFKFDPGTLDDIVERLCGTSPAGLPSSKDGELSARHLPEDKGVDGSQLQKVCMYIEKKAIAQQAQGTELLVDSTFISPKAEIQSILDSFYGEQLKTIGSKSEIQLCREVIEEHLVSGKSRASVTDEQMEDIITKKMGFASNRSPKYFIDKLVEARLIKEEFTHLGSTYELGHETLVNSVSKYAAENKLRKVNKQKFVYLGLLCFSLLCLGACCFLYFRTYFAANKNYVRQASAYYQQGNHFYAFNIWDKYAKRIRISNDDRKLNVDSMLNNTTFFDIGTGLYSFSQNDSIIGVFEADNSVNIWQINSQRTGKPMLLFHHFGARNLTVSPGGDYFGFRASTGELYLYKPGREKQFLVKEARVKVQSAGSIPGLSQGMGYADPGMAFVPGGGYLGFQGKDLEIYIYNLKTGEPQPVASLKPEQPASEFIVRNMQSSVDDKHLAVFNGDTIKVFRIEKGKHRLIREIRDVQQLFTDLRTKMLSYSKTDSIVFEPFDTHRSHLSRRYAFDNYSLSVSPDKEHLSFQDRKQRLYIYSLKSNRVDTVINMDPLPAGKEQSYSRPFVDWLYGGGVSYFGKNGQVIYNFVGSADKTSMLSLKSQYTNGEVTWILDLQGLVMRKAGKEKVVESSIKSFSYYDNRLGNPQVMISSDGQQLCYLKFDATTRNSTIEIISAKDGKSLASLKGFNGIAEIFSPYQIQAVDRLGNRGLIFYRSGRRDRAYYRNLYPVFTPDQMNEIELKLF